MRVIEFPTEEGALARSAEEACDRGCHDGNTTTSWWPVYKKKGLLGKYVLFIGSDEVDDTVVTVEESDLVGFDE
jgi:hypothetical protein